MKEYPLQYASTDRNKKKKSHYNWEVIWYYAMCMTYPNPIHCSMSYREDT